MAPKLYSANMQAVLVGATIGALTILGMYLYQKKRQNTLPTSWKPIGKVKSLYIYPLKSGRRMKLETGECTEFGLQSGTLRDRCLVVYKRENKEFRTARTYPKLLLVEVTVKKNNYFIVNAPGMASLQINISRFSEDYKPDEITLWENEKIFTIDCGDEAAQWFSQYLLGRFSDLRLGFHNGTLLNQRNINKTHQNFMRIYPYLDNSAMGLYTDLSSYLLINQASVDELASRIPNSSITIHNFRPNIVVEGESIGPYAEDNWNWVKIGSVVLQFVKPCARCSLTTLDPETGVRSTNNEPLKTLKTYRKMKDLHQVKLEGEDPAMGINMKLQSGGQINVGDLVYLESN